MKLLLVRHGQTYWNLNHRFQGQSDVPLDAAGLEQARRIAARLDQVEVNAVYASDLARAARTAEEIARPHGLNVTLDSRFRELAFGAWEGLTYQEIQSKSPDLLDKWHTDPLQASAPEGETLTQLAVRVASALDDLRARHNGQTVLLAVHGGTIQTLLCLALGVDVSRYWQFSISSASLTELAFYPRGAIVNMLNDTSHLEQTTWDN